MKSLAKIDGIGEKAIELFRAVGVKSLEDLAGEKTSTLYARLYETNRKKRIYKNLPQIDTVEEWVAAARILKGIKRSGAGKGKKDADEDSRMVSEEILPKDPRKWLRLYADAEEAAVLEKPKVRRGRSRFGKRAPSGSDNTRSPLQARAGKLSKHGLNVTRLIDSGANGGKEGPAGKKTKEADDAGDSSGSPGSEHDAESTSLRMRRGLLHPQPILAFTGAFIALMTRLLFIASVVGAPFAVLFFGDYLVYFAIAPALLLVFAIVYAFLASRVRCRVCGASVLVSRSCLKHENAHRLFGFGYVGSLALHALIFSWFRCLYCGSAMKLRE